MSFTLLSNDPDCTTISISSSTDNSCFRASDDTKGITHSFHSQRAAAKALSNSALSGVKVVSALLKSWFPLLGSKALARPVTPLIVLPMPAIVFAAPKGLEVPFVGNPIANDGEDGSVVLLPAETGATAAPMTEDKALPPLVMTLAV